MKLVNPDFYFPIELHENEVNVIVMESPKDMLKFITELLGQYEVGSGKWILSVNGEIEQINKRMEIIVNPFSLDLNQKRLITKIYDQIQRNVESSELLLEWNRLYPDLSLFVEKLLIGVDYRIDYAKSIELKDFLKFFGVKFIQSEDFLEKILDYITLLNEVVGVKIFLFFHLKSLLNMQQLEILYKQAFYLKVRLLLIESKIGEGIECENIVVVDNNHCVIYNKYSETI